MSFKELLLALFILCQFQLANAQTQITHGRINAQNSKYVLKSQRYIQNYFLNAQGNYTLAKAKQYLERTISERDYLLQQLYETILIEELELRVEKYKDAHEEALEELDKGKSKYAKLYDDFLIPLIKSLVTQLELDANCSSKCDAIVDNFLGAYMAIYTPEKKRSMIYRDIPIFKNLKHLYGFKIYKNNDESIEANNLFLRNENMAEVQSCIGNRAKVNSFLSEELVMELRKCDYDFSQLDPVNSFLWNEKTPSIDDIKKERKMSIFPDEDMVLKYSKVKFSGRGSPKFDAKFKRSGKKYKVKVKLGKEVHVDPIVSTMGKFLGLHQDETRFRRKLKVSFKSKKKYDRFKAQLTRKFGDFFNKNNFTKENTKENGEIVVTFDNVLLEAAREEVTKLNPFAQSGWDNLNRREFRGMLLWFAWMGIRDIKDGNWRVQLAKTAAGLRPQLLFQDVGAVLDGTGTLDKNITDFATDGYRQISVNGFAEKVTKKKKDYVQIKWTDVSWTKDFFSTVTFHDMRWMTRKIAKLTREQIEYAFSLGGLPDIEKRLYVEKVIKRRNDFIKSFELENEYAPIQTMDLTQFNVPGVVEKGEVTAARLEGSIHNQINLNPLFYLSQFINQSVNIGNIQNNMDVFFGNRYGAGVNLNLTDTKKINFDNKKTHVLNYPGIRVELTRQIQLKPGGLHYDDEVQNYYAIDNFVFELNLNVGLFKEYKNSLPITAGLKVNVLKFEFTHWQPSESLEQAIKRPIKIQKIISDIKGYLTNKLKAGETFSYSTGNGVSGFVDASVAQMTRFGMNIGYANASPVYYHRNHYGELEIFKDTQTEIEYGFELGFGLDLGLLFFPLAGFEYQKTSMEGQSTLYRFNGNKEKSLANDPLSHIKGLIEDESLSTLLDGDVEALLSVMHREYQVDYVMDNEKARAFFLLFNRERLNQYSGINITDNEGKKINLHRYMRMDSYKIGEALPLIGGLTLFYGDQNSVDVQLDEDKDRKFVVTLNYYDYERKLYHDDLMDFIDKQNRHFSINKDNPFYSKMHIPSEKEVSKYYKVLAHNRVFIYGDDFMELARKGSRRDLETRIAKYLGMKRLNRFDEHAYERGRIQELARLIRVSADLLEQKKYRAFTNHVSRLVMVLNKTKYGLDPFKRLFGEKNIYVMGEIYGVLNSFSPMPQTTSQARRRFTGKSWGKHKRRPAFWIYLDKHPVLYSTPAPVLKYMDLDAVFGILPTGESFVL